VTGNRSLPVTARLHLKSVITVRLPSRRLTRSIALGVSLLACGSTGLVARQPGSPLPAIDLETIGPKIGAALPDFSLRDQRGEVRTLKSVLGANGAVIVFFRSADW
jgi:hypothetical protein